MVKIYRRIGVSYIDGHIGFVPFKKKYYVEENSLLSSFDIEKEKSCLGFMIDIRKY